MSFLVERFGYGISRAESSIFLTAIVNQAGLFCGSFLRKVEVFA